MGMEQHDPLLGGLSPDFERNQPQLIDNTTALSHEVDLTPTGLALLEDVFRNEPENLELNVSMALALAARHAPNALATNNDLSILGTPSQLLYQEILGKLIAPERSEFPFVYNKLLRKLTPPTVTPDHFSQHLKLLQFAREEYFTQFYALPRDERMEMRVDINVMDLPLRDGAERHIESWCQDLIGRSVSMPLNAVIPDLYLEFGDPQYLKISEPLNPDAGAQTHAHPRTAMHRVSSDWFIADHKRLKDVLNDLTALGSELPLGSKSSAA